MPDDERNEEILEVEGHKKGRASERPYDPADKSKKGRAPSEPGQDDEVEGHMMGGVTPEKKVAGPDKFVSKKY
jgi:hypothetical protein